MCPKRSSSQGAPACLPITGQSKGTMAVANFQYITRMSSGFKVYILEGKLHLLGFCLANSCRFIANAMVMLFTRHIVMYYLDIVTTVYQ